MKTTKKNIRSIPTIKEKKIRRIYRSMAMTLFVTTVFCTSVFASDPITVITNLSSFIFGLIKAVGVILVGWGVVQIGLSIQSHDASQRSQGFLTMAGGVVIFFAQEILTLIGVA